MATEPRERTAPPVLRRACVVGAGPVGCATAAWLSRQGLEVGLCDLDASRIAPMTRGGANGGKVIIRGGVMDGEDPIHAASTQLAEVLPGADLVVMAVPGDACEPVARAAAPYLKDGVVVLFQPGQTLSSMAFFNAARWSGFDGDMTPVETVSTIFTGRLAEPGVAEIYAIKRWIAFAAYPAERTLPLAPGLQRLLPSLVPVGSILETSLANFNAVVHPAVVLLNAGPIDNHRPFLFYHEGATPAVMRLVEAIDFERMALMRALRIPSESLLSWFNRIYDLSAPSLVHAFRTNPPYASIHAPTTLNTRLLLEDLPTGLVPLIELADLAGVPVPAMRGTLALADTILDRDFRAHGRTLGSIGLGGLSAEAVREKLGPVEA
jgi:opine dehydrogenase